MTPIQVLPLILSANGPMKICFVSKSAFLFLMPDVYTHVPDADCPGDDLEELGETLEECQLSCRFLFNILS